MKKKVVRITTVPVSLKILLKGQLNFIQKHFEVIAVSSFGKELNEVKEKEGVRVYNVEMSRNISPLKDVVSIIKMYRFIKHEDPYIVHSHTPKAGFVGMTAAFLAGVPHRLHTVAGLPLMETKGIRKRTLIFVEKFTYFITDLILPNSFGLSDFILKNNLTTEKKLKVLGNGSSNGIDLDFFKSTEQTRYNGQLIKNKYNINSKLVFLFIGRMVSHKGVNELVSAFLDVNRKYPDTVLMMVGEFEKSLDPLSLETYQRLDYEQIIPVGYQPDIRGFLEIADVFVLPSYREGFPNVVLQACAFNLPCIVTDICGCNEIVKNFENGILVPPKEEKKLMDAMELLIANQELRKQLGKTNRLRVESDFEQKYVWDKVLNLYNSL